jgi:putative metal-binding protein/uncharacterized protein DUF1565
LLALVGCNDVLGIERLGPCRDEDGDGFTTCDPDCDDGNAQLHQGQPEICGDGLDNDCEGGPDDICQGLGTYVSATTGDDTNPGTRDAPLRSISKGIAQAESIGHGVDVYISEGGYMESVALVEGVSLFGGYACKEAPCDWSVASPAQLFTDILVQSPEGVVADATITRDTVVDGVSMFTDQSAMETTAMTIDGGAPTLRRAAFGGSIQSPMGCVASYALAVRNTGAEVPLLVDTQSLVGGVCLGGAAIGIDVAAGGAVELQGGIFVGGDGAVTAALRLRGASHAVVTNVDVTPRYCDPADPSLSSFGVSVEDGSDLIIDSARINPPNLSPPQSCGCDDGDADPTNDPWCGGVHVIDGSIQMSNSTAFGFGGPHSAAVVLTAGAPADMVLNANALVGPVAGPPTHVATAAIVLDATTGEPAFGRIRNNVLLGGGPGPQRYGVFEQGAMGARPRPETVDHDAFNDLDVAYRVWDGSAAQDLATTVDFGMLPFATDDFDENCFVNADLHLAPGSACVDRGTEEEAPDHDADGDARPQGGGVDVGIDEVE